MDVTSHVLKAAHHGSNSSSIVELLEEVKPEVSIIICGFNTRYRHPHDGTLERLKQVGSEISRTDKNGNIVIKSDGKEYIVISQRR